jgi:hypothetical protein
VGIGVSTAPAVSSGKPVSAATAWLVLSLSKQG